MSVRGAWPVVLAALCILLGQALVGAPGAAFGQDVQYYRSNDQGMLLARVPAALKDQARWTLSVARDGASEDRRLYNNGKEVHRWQFSWNPAHTERTERESADGKLTARRVYDVTGSLQREEEFRDGKLVKTTRYIYEGGRLARRREFGADGGEIATATYVYAEDGRLRDVRRTVPGSGSNQGPVEVSAWVAGRSGLVEQRSLVDGALFVDRYDAAGRLAQQQRLVAGTVVSTESYSYSSTGSLASSSEERPADSTVVDRSYDGQGRLASETTRVRDQVTQSSTWEYDAAGKVVVRARRGHDGLELWRYRYADGGKLSREEYTQRGVLVKVVVYGAGGHRTEELYRRGEVFLKVFFDGDARVREEVYSGGVLVRERDYP